MDPETSIWKGRSSQWLNAGNFAVAALVLAAVIAGGCFFPWVFLAAVLPLAHAAWKFLGLHTTIYELTSERLRTTSGIINQTVDEIELYRVKDSVTLRPWWMRLTGLATIELETSDRSKPGFVIPAVRDGVALREDLRRHVEIQRDHKRVREMDLDEAGGGSADLDEGSIDAPNDPEQPRS
jgi:uncharacterized membrane protein YdbT with pleckstrin-like domain